MDVVESGDRKNKDGTMRGSVPPGPDCPKCEAPKPEVVEAGFIPLWTFQCRNCKYEWQD